MQYIFISSCLQYYCNIFPRLPPTVWWMGYPQWFTNSSDHAACALQGAALCRRPQGRRHLYWSLQNEDEKKWKCNQCPITRVKGNGWTNLDTHVFEKHTDYKEKLAEFQRSNSKGISSFFNAASEDPVRVKKV